MGADASVFRTSRRVEFRDTDAAGLAHFSVFFVWMESVEHEFWRHLGEPLVMPLGPTPQAGVVTHPRPSPGGDIISWPRVAAACDYEGAVRFGDVLAVELAVERVGRTSVRFGFRFAIGSQTVAVGSMTAVRCILRPGERPEPVRIPEVLRERLEAHRTTASKPAPGSAD